MKGSVQYLDVLVNLFLKGLCDETLTSIDTVPITKLTCSTSELYWHQSLTSHTLPNNHGEKKKKNGTWEKPFSLSPVEVSLWHHYHHLRSLKREVRELEYTERIFATK